MTKKTKYHSNNNQKPPIETRLDNLESQNLAIFGWILNKIVDESAELSKTPPDYLSELDELNSHVDQGNEWSLRAESGNVSFVLSSKVDGIIAITPRS